MGDGIGPDPGSGSRTERFLGIRSGDVLAFVGGGGKSTLIHALAARLAKEGRKVVTTATRPFLPPPGDSPHVFLTGERPFRDLPPNLSEHGAVTVAPERLPDGMLRGYSPGELETFARVGDYLLVEAEDSDGESLPEPVSMPRPVPPVATVLCAVAGLDALKPDLSEEAFAAILAAEGGVLHCRPDIERRILFLHKGDRSKAQAAGARIAVEVGRLCAGGVPTPKVLVTSVRDFLKRI